MERALLASRAEDSRGPLVVGPNCMGIASDAGGYDTTFIPQSKLPRSQGSLRNVAMISQSGAFAIARLSKLASVRARYLSTAGNQLDVSIADCVAYGGRDPLVDVLAVYVEGFQFGDGARFLEAARRAREAGKVVVLYKGGRSPEGQCGGRAHGLHRGGLPDHLAPRARGGGARGGDLRRLRGPGAPRRGARPGAGRGRRVFLMSNAGFEAVGMADSLRGEGWSLTAARPGGETLATVREALARFKIDALVDVKNPLDITPVAPDAVHLACARAVLADPGVDALVIGLVPMSPAMSTLPESEDPRERLDHPEGLAKNLGRVAREGGKPVVAVVDAGSLDDPFAEGDGGRRPARPAPRRPRRAPAGTPPTPARPHPFPYLPRRRASASGARRQRLARSASTTACSSPRADSSESFTIR